MIQTPSPGHTFLMFKGDTVTFTLLLPTPLEGDAFLRTNLGHASLKRFEIIRLIEEDIPISGRDWFDIPMIRKSGRLFTITLALCETGHFEAKCFFLEKEKPDPLWPEGGNSVINVEPAFTCSGNIIYNAFVRQFGPNIQGGFDLSAESDTAIQHLDKKGYTVIPPSGTFRDLKKKLDFITGTLGCRFIYLLPVHPTPTTYARMGRFGSPYAALSFTAVDPAQAEFDPTATPLEQFEELIDAIHGRHARLILDFAINHTGWAASLHESHPEWLVRDEHGRIENPGAWGVLWSDLTRLDYSKKELWKFMASVFLLWCKRGVDGFRCDAGYMIPVPAWQYIVSVVREQFPDTLFFLEGLGGKISVTRDILNTGNFNWAYSELFQNYDRGQIEGYLPEAWDISAKEGLMVHFAETHDNNRLAAQSHPYAVMRTTLSALMSVNGAFGFANGVEWFATEKIIVHESKSLNWGASENQVHHIQRLSLLLKHHPCFFDGTTLRFIQKGEGNFIALLRRHLPSGKKLIVLVNLECGHPVYASFDKEEAGFSGALFFDLLSGRSVSIRSEKTAMGIELEPCGVMCLTDDPADTCFSQASPQSFPRVPDPILLRQYRIKALEGVQIYQGQTDISGLDLDFLVTMLKREPVEFYRSLNRTGPESRVVTFRYPHDVNREVMVPPSHFLLVEAETHFYATLIFTVKGESITLRTEESLMRENGHFFTVFTPIPTPMTHQKLSLKLSLFYGDKFDHVTAPLYYLTHGENVGFKTVYGRSGIDTKKALLLRTNGRGGMLRAPISWGSLKSRYDALLAANPHPSYPVDRWIMLSRLRGWVVFQGYSQEIHFDCFHAFSYRPESGGFYRFHVPVGQGEHVSLTINLDMTPEKNAIRVLFYRQPARNIRSRLDDSKKVTLILRPDIESRNFHALTKAYTGPEHQFPSAVTPEPDGFVFHPSPDHVLRATMKKSLFVDEKEWLYMVHRPDDENRGMDGHSDLFSPGYFKTFIAGNDVAELMVQCDEPRAPSRKKEAGLLKPLSNGEIRTRIRSVRFSEKEILEPLSIMTATLRDYLVRRNGYQTVIAGYPWFLDWGRDSLIFVRGLIAAGFLEEAKKVLCQFGKFEERGTLPNMIAGNDAANRDTVDAALWFFVAVKDIVDTEANECFLDTRLGSRSLRKILIDMGEALIRGTENGIWTDKESGLLFSPAHFTWMDTNFPAGTPREGYAIEIQALWYQALTFLSTLDGNGKNDFMDLAQKVRRSVHDLYIQEGGYLADILHGEKGAPARLAEKDDAIRPNQLFAITMGLVSDQALKESILSTAQMLLIPGAIRSLSNLPVKRPLVITLHGRALNDPYHPYQGRYEGDEDTKRKPAYHNGTAWTWIFPSFCEAWAMTYGDAGKKTALAYLSTGMDLLTSGAIGHMPEILDGDYPHEHRGCDAQAWGVSEYVRVWKKLV